MSAAPSRLHTLFAIDYRSLAALRVMTALTALWVLSVWALDLEALFSDNGVLPLAWAPAVDNVGRFSLLHLTGAPLAAWALWAVGLLAALSLLLGWRARGAAAILLLCYLSFVGRNPLIAQGGDVLMPLLLFWMIFLPVGAVFSVEAALSPRNLRSETPHLSIATVGLLLQVLYVYVFGALLKTDPAWWPNGSAVYVALHLDTFVTPVGEMLRQSVPIMFLLTMFVFGIELFAPILLFFPDRGLWIRRITLALLMLMHLGFRVFLHIGHFWLASLSSLCAYIPTAWWSWADRLYWRRGQERIDIYYDRDCGFCLKVALILREFFLPRAVPIRPAQDFPEMGAILEREVSWIVIAPDGRRLLHWDAVTFVMRQSPLLAPLGWLAWLYGRIGLGRPTYDWIGRNRTVLGRLTAGLTPNGGPVRHGPVVTGFLALAILFAFAWNVRGLSPPPRAELPPALTSAAAAVGWTQYWDMFAPAPPTLDGVPVLAATGPAGEIDLFRGGAPVDLSWPDDALSLFPSHRWRAFILRASYEEPAMREALMARWAGQVCAAWNEAHPDRAVGEVTVKFVRNQTLSAFQERIEVETLATAPCR